MGDQGDDFMTSVHGTPPISYGNCEKKNNNNKRLILLSLWEWEWIHYNYIVAENCCIWLNKELTLRTRR